LVAACSALAGCGGDDGQLNVADEPPKAPLAPTTPASSPLFRLEPVVRKLEEPVYVTAADAQPDVFYVVERAGRIRVVTDGRLRPKPLLDIGDRVRTEIEEGLHSVAFHPDYPDDPRLFVAYNDLEGDLQVAEYRVEDAHAIPESARTLFSIDRPEGVKWHNGGQLQFDPDGELYVSSGDAARNPYDEMPNPPRTPDPDNNAQNLDLLFGKLLRLDVDEEVPEPELVAYGLRNTWRFSFDRETGDLVLADVGQFAREEIDFVPAGTADVLNFGWSVYEGTTRFNGDHALGDSGALVWPILEYQHPPGPLYCPGRASITGGYVYRGTAVTKLRSRYVFGDYCSGELWTLRIVDGKATEVRMEPAEVSAISSFGEDGRGELYATALNEGVVYRLVAPG
jgi:glucose/arabinose dehydrogenase